MQSRKPVPAKKRAKRYVRKFGFERQMLQSNLMWFAKPSELDIELNEQFGVEPEKRPNVLPSEVKRWWEDMMANDPNVDRRGLGTGRFVPLQVWRFRDRDGQKFKPAEWGIAPGQAFKLAARRENRALRNAEPEFEIA